jgi:hypothetical protein
MDMAEELKCPIPNGQRNILSPEQLKDFGKKNCGLWQAQPAGAKQRLCSILIVFAKFATH